MLQLIILSLKTFEHEEEEEEEEEEEREKGRPSKGARRETVLSDSANVGLCCFDPSRPKQLQIPRSQSIHMYEDVRSTPVLFSVHPNRLGPSLTGGFKRLAVRLDPFPVHDAALWWLRTLRTRFWCCLCLCLSTLASAATDQHRLALVTHLRVRRPQCNTVMHMLVQKKISLSTGREPLETVHR